MSDLILQWAEPLILSVVALLVGLCFNLLRKLPSVLRVAIGELKKHAANTPTKADDAAVALLAAVVDALDKALSAELPDKKSKR